MRIVTPRGVVLRGFLDPPLPQEGQGTGAMEQVTKVNKSNSIWLHKGDKRSQIAMFFDLNVNNNQLDKVIFINNVCNFFQELGQT